LNGIRILDLTQVTSGPFWTMPASGLLTRNSWPGAEVDRRRSPPLTRAPTETVFMTH